MRRFGSGQMFPLVFFSLIARIRFGTRSRSSRNERIEKKGKKEKQKKEKQKKRKEKKVSLSQIKKKKDRVVRSTTMIHNSC